MACQRELKRDHSYLDLAKDVAQEGVQTHRQAFSIDERVEVPHRARPSPNNQDRQTRVALRARRRGP